tara:strand:+ start:1975 stop:2109 length:135 start_codon:yes stop_codon:yes gene_type:complete
MPSALQRLVVARDGMVSPCCVDWNQDYVVGDVNKESCIRKNVSN